MGVRSLADGQGGADRFGDEFEPWVSDSGAEERTIRR